MTLLAFCVGVVISRRMLLAFTGGKSWRVMLAVLPATVATGAKFAPSVLRASEKSRVLSAGSSPPAPAWRRMMWLIGATAVRLIWKVSIGPKEQNLSVRPPLTVPLTAFSGPSVGAQGAG